jgi:hypothetical protein
MTEYSSLESISSKDDLADPLLREGWEKLVEEYGSPYGMYASPDWVLHILGTSGHPVRVWKARDSAGQLEGLVPVEISEYSLSFEAANRKFVRVPLQTAHVLGGVPPLPKDPASHFRFFDAVFSELPECDCLHCDMVPWDNWFSEFLRQDRQVRQRYVVHSPFGARNWHMMRIAGTFEDYLGRMGSKSRHRLRNNVRKLEKRAERFELRRVDRADQVEEFLRFAAEVSRNSWQHQDLGEQLSDDETTKKTLMSLADRCLLRCYILFSGDEPCAFSTAYQRRGTINCHEFGFDQRLQRYSPGKVLLYLMIEDLYADSAVTLLNFGMGDAEYKRQLADIETTESSWLIMRRSIRNRILVKSHSILDGTVEFAKKVFRKRKSA